MILGYLPRLLCIGMAAYCLIHVALGMVVSLAASPAIRRAHCLQPGDAAGWLLTLRLAPAMGAAFVVVAVCLPSYLWLEPSAPSERVSWLCLAAAAVGLAIWVVSLARAARAAFGSWRFLRRCRRADYQVRADAWLVDSAAPLMAVAGILRPRLIVSRSVLRALSVEQFAAAVRHERAHQASRDNLKRLCMLLVPGILPLSGSSRMIERSWHTFAEWAADDDAVDGSARHSRDLACDLAAALVRVARIGGNATPMPLATSLLGDSNALEARVDRLLHRRSPDPPMAALRPGLTTSAIALTAVALVLVVLRPEALNAAHQALEHLIR